MLPWLFKRYVTIEFKFPTEFIGNSDRGWSKKIHFNIFAWNFARVSDLDVGKLLALNTIALHYQYILHSFAYITSVEHQDKIIVCLT